MRISNVTKESMVDFVIGSDDSIWPVRTGKNLVSFFQKLGFRDDVYENGLPRLSPNSNTSKKQYVRDRLLKLKDDKWGDFFQNIVSCSRNKEQAIEVLNKILVNDNLQLRSDGDSVQIMGLRHNAQSINQAHFIENENKVIEAIRSAQVSILVAMAWFTNERIKDALEAKLKEGLRIEIVIYKDGVNALHGVDLSSFDHVEIRGTRGGIMHNKFCVIDNQQVITGSYNWSTNAEVRNDENVLLTQDNAMSTKFSVEFRRLKPLT